MCMFDVVCFSVVTKPIARVNDSRLEGVNTLTRFLQHDVCLGWQAADVIYSAFIMH